jgi:hypothetical protein
MDSLTRFDEKKEACRWFYWKKISSRYFRKGFIFNFKAVFISKCLSLHAQPVSLWGAHASWRRSMSR